MTQPAQTTASTEIFLHLAKSSWEDTYRLYITDSDMTAYGYVLIEKRTVTIDIPDASIIANKHVKALEAKIKRLDATVAVEKEEIRNEIAALQQLTFKAD
jgi:hypothetical protein